MRWARLASEAGVDVGELRIARLLAEMAYQLAVANGRRKGTSG
jgi:hypothetical protein